MASPSASWALWVHTVCLVSALLKLSHFAVPACMQDAVVLQPRRRRPLPQDLVLCEPPHWDAHQRRVVRTLLLLAVASCCRTSCSLGAPACMKSEGAASNNLAGQWSLLRSSWVCPCSTAPSPSLQWSPSAPSGCTYPVRSLPLSQGCLHACLAINSWQACKTLVCTSIRVSTLF